MTDNSEHIFYFSKKKIIISILLQLVFIGLFLFIMTMNFDVTTSRYVVARLLSPIALVIVLINLSLTGRKLFDKTPVVIISFKGITIKGENKISWQEIKYIHESKVIPWKLFGRLERYLNNSITFTLRHAERPVRISTSLLNINFNELANLVKQYHKKYDGRQ